MVIPSARIAEMVQRQSSLGRNPRITQAPLLMAASITARWETLLSPGTDNSVWMMGARRTFQSDIGGDLRLPQAIALGFGFGQELVH